LNKHGVVAAVNDAAVSAQKHYSGGKLVLGGKCGYHGLMMLKWW